MFTRFFAVAALLAASVAPSAALDRSALWSVEQLCITNARAFGAAFPCLDVDVGDGLARGYAVLQTPLGKRDIVLMPTTKVSGIEDPFLTSDKAPNYFALAWRARRYAQEKAERALRQEDFALAVNSRTTRSQDQFHIHIGCVRADLKARIGAIGALVGDKRWSRLPAPLHGDYYWARRIEGGDLTGVDVPRLLTSLSTSRGGGYDGMTVAVVGARLPGGRDGFIVLAADTTLPGRKQTAAEDLIDHACRVA